MAKKKKEIEIKDHQLSISYLKIWWRLLRENKIDNWAMVYRIWGFVLITQIFQLIQSLFFSWRVKRTDIHTRQPLFILGHWRSGTTHLHYMMARDPQFAFLNNYQAFLINVVLLGRGWLKFILSPLMPDGRPQDNIKMSVNEPAEEEQPLTNMTACSGMHSFFFPRNISYYEKFNLFKGIRKGEKRRWRRNYTYLLKLISYVNGKRPLLLKNPHNTSRVKELLEIFPNAKFIYIHRNPYDVYHSTVHLYKKTISTQFLQDFSQEETVDRILYCYETTMRKYYDERSLIPKENLVEVSFEELEKNGMATAEKIYSHLRLPGFSEAQPHIQKYFEEVKNYEKNKFVQLSPEIKERIDASWDFAFEIEGYSKTIINEDTNGAAQN